MQLRAAVVAFLFVFLVIGHIVLLTSETQGWWWYVLILVWHAAIYAAIDQAIKWHAENGAITLRHLPPPVPETNLDAQIVERLQQEQEEYTEQQQGIRDNAERLKREGSRHLYGDASKHPAYDKDWKPGKQRPVTNKTIQRIKQELSDEHNERQMHLRDGGGSNLFGDDPVMHTAYDSQWEYNAKSTSARAPAPGGKGKGGGRKGKGGGGKGKGGGGKGKGGSYMERYKAYQRQHRAAN